MKSVEIWSNKATGSVNNEENYGGDDDGNDSYVLLRVFFMLYHDGFGFATEDLGIVVGAGCHGFHGTHNPPKLKGAMAASASPMTRILEAQVEVTPEL